MAQTLYIIHGWTYTTAHWEKTISLLKEAGVNVKMLHVPGLTEPSKKVFTITDYTKWADANIPNGAIALGHSNGGRILLNLLSEKPDKLKHLILLNSAGVYEPSKKRSFFRTIAKIGAPLKKNAFFAKAFHKIIGASDYDHAPENMKQTLTNMLESDKNLQLEQVTTPTTILWGKEDTTTPPRQANIMNEKLPNSTLKFYEHWPHAPYIYDPAGLARAIATAVKEQN